MRNMSDNKKSLKKIKTGRFSRSMAIAKVSILTGAKAATFAAKSLVTANAAKSGGLSAMMTAQAELIADELGQLKGSFMKVGQMLSMMGEYYLPPEVSNALKKLQSDSEPIAWEVMEKVLKFQLKEKLAELDIEQVPYASASIGQVYVCTVKATGEKICLKVQYPGIDKAMDSDIDTLKTFLMFGKLLPKNMDFDPLFQEVRYMLRRELDYKLEHENTIEFGELLKDDPRYVVPTPLTEFCTKRVLATKFESGSQISAEVIEGYSQERRDFVGIAMLELFYKEFFHWGKVQTDPHFGNYLIKTSDDGKPDQLVVLDFGAVRNFSKKFLTNYRAILAASFRLDKAACIESGRKLGFLNENESEKNLDNFYQIFFLAMEPYRLKEEEGYMAEFVDESGHYMWNESDVGKRLAKNVSKFIMSMKVPSPPRELVFFDRKITGLMLAMQIIGPRFDARKILLGYIEQ